MTPAIQLNERRTDLWCAALFGVALFGFLYWNYPFGGMVISDGWYWYLYETGDFRWPLPAHQSGNLEAVSYIPDWSVLTTRRGLMPVLVMGIDHLVMGDKRVFLNLVCLVVQLTNLGLFGLIVSSLAGAQWVFPSLAVAALYPFASGSHFWQHLILNNLAATFFLLSLWLFLVFRRLAKPELSSLAAMGSLGLFWVSIITVDYAIFMSPLYLYLALYFENGGRRLLRFERWVTPYTCLGAGFLGLSALAGILFAGSAPTFLIYSSRFEELAGRLGLPVGLLVPLAVLANVFFSYLSVAWFNTLGFLLQPAWAVWRDQVVLRESPWTLAGILLVVGTLAVLWRRAERRVEWAASVGPNEGSSRVGLLCLTGLLWAVLAYLPFSMAFGYPRMVGFTADRVNIVAQWGVALCLGLFARQALAWTRRGGMSRRVLGSVLGLSAAAVLVANLYIQREYYVEDYRKEQEVARLVLTSPLFRFSDGQTPVVLLDRKAKLEFPREQLLGAVGDSGSVSRAVRVLRFLVERYFFQNPVTSSFHLNGIMMFGCCPNSAQVTFDGYARWLRQEPLPIYKRERPFYLEQEGEAYLIGYRDTEVWSNSFGGVRIATYPKQAYRVLRLEIEESFFHLRGSLVYNVMLYNGSDT